MIISMMFAHRNVGSVVTGDPDVSSLIFCVFSALVLAITASAIGYFFWMGRQK